MKDELVTFETAKLAKEKGYDWEVFKMYGTQDIPQLETFDAGIHIMWKLNKAPTQSLLQRWLREKHGIHICMVVSNSGSYFASIYSLYTEQFLMMHISSTKDETYESVLEIALQEGLKLITSKT